jgi:hypothetical protein
MMIKLESMAVEMPDVAGHPNRAAFQGVLTVVDLPSQRSPSGAKGHLVVLTKKAAETALPSLLGMALDYSPAFDRHDVKRKVGVITRADIIGQNLEVGGYLFARDFPEIVNEIEKTGRAFRNARWRRQSVVHCAACPGASRQRTGSWAEGRRLGSTLRAAAERIQRLATMLHVSETRFQTARAYCRTIRAETGNAVAGGRGGLGLSYEVTDVVLTDIQANLWMLEKVTFTGAAILRRDKAAYPNTWIELCD